MSTKKPEAIRIAEWLECIRGNTWPSYIPQEAAAELRRQHAEIETLRAGYDAARLEIASLHTQMDAVGAGGMEPLRKRECLHKISEPANAGWCDGCSPDNCGGCVTPASPAQAGEYPELPDLYSTGAPFWRAVLAWHDAHHGPEAINAADKLDMLVADMLRAYVDADRAASSVYSRSMDLVRVFWQQHTESDALSMTMAELHDDVELVIRAARGAAHAAPATRTAPALWTGEQAYTYGRGDYEVAMISGGHAWELFGNLSVKEQARWISHAAAARAQAAPVDAAVIANWTGEQAYAYGRGDYEAAMIVAGQPWELFGKLPMNTQAMWIARAAAARAAQGGV